MIQLEPLTASEKKECFDLSREFQRKYVNTGKIGDGWHQHEPDRTTDELKIRDRWFGFCGSKSISKLFGLPWHEGDINKWNNRTQWGDAGELDVRTRSQIWHELTVRPTDRRVQLFVRPVSNWNLKSENWKKLPILCFVGFHFPWYIRENGHTLPQKGIFALPDKLLIPPEYLIGRVSDNSLQPPWSTAFGAG